ncbi:hypothetical protein [Vibrio marisflavi]|uniref:Flagellar basal-body/hook protein C-terminal domain-containing protein n=1 Tax=Vibrio marisflavi CECT 7928 TaxID=634439 RepID=A0ABM9A014_9VIBR|nr:hypothetical protein [Vibrio marisflavi]CAH0536732.1 hypothetical protein VMF7928_00652 [Vibrio marisflavi CECT 7928]
MSVSVSDSGYQIINQSSKMAEEAAREIKDKTLPTDHASPSDVNKTTPLEFNKVEFDKAKPEKTVDGYPASHTDALVKLNQSTRYHQIGTNVLQRDQDMIGTLLDIHV